MVTQDFRGVGCPLHDQQGSDRDTYGQHIVPNMHYSDLLPPAKLYLLKLPLTLKIVPQSKAQPFKHASFGKARFNYKSRHAKRENTLVCL